MYTKQAWVVEWGLAQNYNKINKKVLDCSAQSNPRENLAVSLFLPLRKNLKMLHSTVYTFVKTKQVHNSGPGVPIIFLSRTQ